MTKVGDVFEVDVEGNCKQYLQHIANDVTQMSSNVIRVFKSKYPPNSDFDIEAVVNDEVEFYAHCITKWGVRDGVWRKTGSSENIGSGHVSVFFRDSGDVGNIQIKISQKWWVWKINEEQRFVGALEGVLRESEIGIVLQPRHIVDRMTTGTYHFVYPGV
ncbi:MAG: hypothetical protein ABI162_17560 [Luteolibacter sp.]